MRRNFASIVAVGLVLGALPLAHAKLTRTGDVASASFDAKGPAGMKITGSTSEVAVGDDGKVVAVTVTLKNLTTGIGLRDTHMRDKYLQVGQFPTAELKVDRGSLKFPSGNEVSGDAKGTITIHGKSKQVDFHYNARGPAKGPIVVNAITDVNMKDFDITVPTYLGVTVKPEVHITVSFTVNDS